MTAKHRKGKSNNKHEDNFFKNEVTESEARAGGNNYILLLVLFLIIVIGGAIGGWFCFQQHQTLTYLTDNLTGLQMKIAKLQSSHEDLRQSSGKQYISGSLETRLNVLEESYALAQKQMGIALATAEQLKMSDLPAQVLSLHTEMKARLTEMQQSTASLEQLSQLHTMLKGKSEDFESVKNQVKGLVVLSAELSQKVEFLTGSLGEAESKLKGQVVTLSTTLDAQAAEMLRLKKQLNTYQAQVEASTQEAATVRELLESEQSPMLHQANVDEQLNTVRQSLQDQSSAALELKAQLENLQKQVIQLMGEHPGDPMDQNDEETAPTAREVAAEVNEQEAPATDVEKEAFSQIEEAEANEHGEAPVQEEAPTEKQDTVSEVLTPVEQEGVVKENQTEQDESIASSESKEVDTTQREEKVPEEEKADEEEESKGEEVIKDSQLEEESQKAEEEEEEEELETEEADEDNQPEEEAASEEERELEEMLLEEEEVAEEQEQQDVAAGGQEPPENESLSEDECK